MNAKVDVWPLWMHQKAGVTGVPIEGYGNKIDDFKDGIDIIGVVRAAIRGSFCSNANQTQILHL